MRCLIAVASWIVLIPARAVAQCTVVNTGSCSQQQPIALTIPYAAEMTLSGAATTLTTPLDSNLTSGRTVDPGPSVTVRANGAWRVNVQANAATWSYTGPFANPSKPASDLLVGTSPSGPFAALSNTTPYQLASGSAATASTVVTVYYETLWGWTTSPPGTYSLALTFTITSP